MFVVNTNAADVRGSFNTCCIPFLQFGLDNFQETRACVDIDEGGKTEMSGENL